MRLLVDANLSPVVANSLRDAGHDTLHVGDVGLLAAADEVIVQAAAEDSRVIVSADADFVSIARGRLRVRPLPVHPEPLVD